VERTLPSRVLTKQFRKTQLRTRRAILVATFLILSLGGFSAWQMVRLGTDAAAVAQSYEAIRAVRRLRTALLSAETAKRGFLLTGDRSYLGDYSAGVEAVPGLVADLRRRLAPYVAAHEQQALEAAIDVKLGEMAKVLELYEGGRGVEAIQLVNSNVGKSVMDELSWILERVRRGEEGRLAAHHASFQRTRNLGLLTVAAVGGFAVLVTVFLLRGQRAATERLVAAVDIIQGQKGYLEAMLSSMSWPLILLDRNGTIRFVNAASVELLGDSAESLIGRPLDQYVQFRGASERSGEGTIFERAISERRILRERRVGIETPRGPQVIGLTVRPVEVEGAAPIGCMITLRDIDEEEATIEALHQQDRVRDLEATLGRVVAETASARSLLERCCEAIRQTTDALAVHAWVGDATDPNARLTLLRRTAVDLDWGQEASALLQDAWRRGVSRQDGASHLVFPLSSESGALGVIEIRLHAPLHAKLAHELPRLASETALGYDRRRKAEMIARLAGEKDRFIATLSHELRGPLTPLKYAVGELASTGGAEPRVLGILNRQVTQLERLVDDLLDVQRLQRGTLSLRLAPLDMRTVVEHGIEAALPLLEGKQQKLQVEQAKEPLPVLGDQARLVQVLFNLLNNASRYSPVGASIRLSAQRTPGLVEVRVADDGIGIAEEQLERVFRMYEQGSTGGSSEGFGIGLALVRQLVVLHGGKVLASSDGVGAGATFGLQLPLAPSIQGTLEPVRSTSAGAAGLARVESIAAAPTSRAPMFHRCVVVDDDVDSAEAIALMLESWGLTADVAHDAREAFEAIQRVKPELVLLDLTLPGEDRFSLVERLRSKIGPVVRVVAVTGHADEQVRREALRRGFDDLLVKPISAEQLANAARRVSLQLN